MKRNKLLVTAAVMSIIETVLSFMLLICSITLEIFLKLGVEFTSEWFTQTEDAEMIAENVLIVVIVLIALFLCISLYDSFVYLANCSKSYEKMHEKIAPMAVAVVLNYVKLGIISASIAVSGASKTGTKVKAEKPADKPADKPAAKPADTKPSPEVYAQLNALRKLRDEGKISEAEYLRRQNELIKPQ